MLFILILSYYLSFTFLVLTYRHDEDFRGNIAISLHLSNALLALAFIIGGFIK